MPRPCVVLVVAITLVAGVGCQGGGNVSLFGYTTAPPFDPAVKTVYLPVFKTVAFHTAPYRGIEVDVTEAVVREINGRRTPMRIVSSPAGADTELIGTITAVGKSLQNRDLLNFNREFDVVITCELVWRDLRTGRSLAYARPFPPPPSVANPFDPSLEVPPPPAPDTQPGVVTIAGFGRVLPELGESNTTGAQAATKNLAKQIVNMMEKPW